MTDVVIEIPRSFPFPSSQKWLHDPIYGFSPYLQPEWPAPITAVFLSWCFTGIGVGNNGECTSLSDLRR
jgi:hypothetical protein